MKTIIIYYSQSGLTGIVSQVLTHNLKADMVKIHDMKSRRGLKNKLIAPFDAYRENKTIIEPQTIDLSNYDLVYIGTPVWASKPTPAILTIIDSIDLRGKDTILFATMSGSGGNSTIDRMEEKVKSRGGRVIKSFTIKTKDKSKKQLIRDTEIIIDKLDLKIYK